MNSSFSGLIRWKGTVSRQSGPTKSNWTLIQGNVSHITRWVSGSGDVPTVPGTSGYNLWTVIQGNVARATRWTSRTVSLTQNGGFNVTGAIHATFTPVAPGGFRVSGNIATSFVTGGSVTVGGGFTHIGNVIASFKVSPSAGFQVDGEIIARFSRRAGQDEECISGSGVPDPLVELKNAVH